MSETPGRRYKRVEDLEGDQRAAAMAGANAVVAAGAGSGKTTVLAARYVRLLEEGRLRDGSRARPRNLLVLSFTRKAAAEMYSRIYGALAEGAALAAGRAAAGDDAAAPLADHLAGCLASFSEAQISTFDSFAGTVARSGCARFGLAPDFAVDDGRAGELARRLALEFLLEKRGDEAMRELVAADGFIEVRDLLAEVAVERMPLSSPPDFGAMHAAQEGLLRDELGRLRAALLDERAAALEYAGGKVAAGVQAWLDAFAADPEASPAPGLGAAGGAPEGAPDDASEVAPGGDSLLAWIAGFKNLRKPASNSASEAGLYLSGAVEGFKKLAAAYCDHAAALVAHPGRRGLYLLLDEFRLRWEAGRRAEKVLSFRDAATMALDLLSRDPSLRAYYKGLFRFVMIDEFQDDDELQKRVLFLVAERDSRRESGEPGPDELEPDKLFFVGDEKQSIYLFRGADVAVFRSLPHELARSAASAAAPSGASGEGVPRADDDRILLARNFRSEPGLIDALNAIFPAVMAPEDGAEARPYEAVFEPILGREATPGVEPTFSYLELPYRPDGTEGFRARAECEAWRVAEFIRDSVESGRLPVADRKTGKARPARYEDFSVLFRATGKQVHFEKYLRLLGVPYASESACGLFSEAVASDLYYALRLAAHPEDRNALAAFLLSPFASLGDEAVARLLLADLAPGAPGAAELMPDEASRAGLARAAATLAGLAALADRAPLAAAVSYLWYEAGYRAALLANPAAQAFEEHFELFHSLAVKADAGNRSLAAFVAGLEPLVGSPDKLDDAELPREDARGVRLMTIHKSKGLEFPVVILPQANNAGRDRDGAEPWAWDGRAGVTFKLPSPGGDYKRKSNVFFEHASEERKARQRAEARRLLYVALTRAESHIVVTATAPCREETKRPRSFRAFLLPALGLAPGEGPGEDGLPAGGEAGEAGTASGGAAATSGRVPMGTLSDDRLRPLGPGIFAGLIPERSDEAYEGLLRESRARVGRVEPGSIPMVERSVAPRRRAVSAIARDYAESRPAPETARPLAVAPGLGHPEGLDPAAWGSLVHAVLEERLRGPAPAATPARPLSPAAAAALESALPAERARSEALARAERLAAVFLGSELGQRALAAPDRLVEWPLALAYDSRGGRRIAKGTVDLVIVERDRALVVDYKTDAAFEPGRYDLQVAAYRRATESILGLPTEAYLFYLHGGGVAVRVDEVGLAPGLGDAPPTAALPRDFSFLPATDEGSRDGRRNEEES